MIFTFATNPYAMPKAPPLLPEEVLRRVTRVASTDGLSILIVAGGLSLVSATMHDVAGTIVGLAVAGAGVIEMHGSTMLRRGEFSGLRWLVNSQMLLLMAIMSYVSYRTANPEPAAISMITKVFSVDRAQFDLALSQSGLTQEQFVLSFYRFALFLVSVVSLGYQGGLAIYYFRRREPIARALTEAGFDLEPAREPDDEE